MRVIDLSSGAGYFRSPDAATEAAIKSLQRGETKYGPTEGIATLREAIAARYIGTAISVSPKHVLLTSGSKQALFNLFTVLLRAGDEVVIPTPAWFGFHGLLKYSKGKLVNLPTLMSEGYTITPEALRYTLSAKTRVLLLTNPGNPTGRLYSKDELEAILKVTANYPDLYIISDEIYDFDIYGKPFTSIFSCQGAVQERTIVVNGFSKTFAMSGWRIGYIVGPAALIERCADFQGSTLSGISIFIQEAAFEILKNKEEALTPMLSVLAENRLLMQQGLDAIPHIRYYLPDGAYYFFPDFSEYFGKTTSAGKIINTSIDLCDYLLEQYHLQLSPGDYFGTPGHARMSFAVEKPDLQEALIRLKEALTSLHSDSPIL